MSKVDSFGENQGKSLLEGKFPSVDQYGNMLTGSRGLKANTLIAGGWRGAFESWTGDWKERCTSHAFIRRNYQSTMQCDQCKAVQPHKKTPNDLLPLIYSDFRVDAPWTKTLRNHADYLNETPEAHRTPWLAVPGFDINRVRWDSAHTILLGTGKDVAGSFLCDLVSRQWIDTFFCKHTPKSNIQFFPFCVSHWFFPVGFFLASEVELSILQRLQAKGVTSLTSLQGISMVVPDGQRVDARGNCIMNKVGMAFRRWCRLQRIETPPCTWNLHMIGRGDSDSKNQYPVLDSNIKAAHVKPILFFLSGLATEISTFCDCILSFLCFDVFWKVFALHQRF